MNENTGIFVPNKQETLISTSHQEHGSLRMAWHNYNFTTIAAFLLGVVMASKLQRNCQKKKNAT